MPNLNIPHRKQKGFGYCLPACVQMVLAYFGTERSQDDLAKQMSMIVNAGTPASRVLRLASRDLHVLWQPGTVADLINAIVDGTPPILPVATRQLSYWREDTYHVVLLAGIDDIDNPNIDDRPVLIYDPARDEPMTIRLDELMLAWDDMENYFALLKQQRRTK